jgi:hypothetical protein
MKIWDSEGSRELTDAKTDPWTVMLDDENGVLVLASYDSTGAHYLNLLFFGPKTDEYGKVWTDAAYADEDFDVLGNPLKLIRSVFGLPDPD